MKVALALLMVTACQSAPKSESVPSAARSASPAPSADVRPASRAWFEGPWRGAFQAELFRMDVAAGGVKEWKTDDGKEGAGSGELSLQASPDGTVSGTGKGALGELTVSGRFEGDGVTLSLTPVEPGGFQGVVVASRAGLELKGTLRASSGDSLRVRQAAVVLSRVSP